MDVFAPDSAKNNSFIVQNTSPQVKTISIFNYPINYGQLRDLMKIPGVSGGDISSSLSKGQLNYKIRCNDIHIVYSDIELIQFSSTQLAFLQAAGIQNGLQITSDQMSVIWLQDVMLNGVVDGYNLTYTIPSGTWLQQGTYKIVVYKNGVKQVAGDDFIIGQSVPGNGYDTVIFNVAPTIHPSPPDVITADYYVDNT